MLAGCGSERSSDGPVRLDADIRTATVESGDTLELTIGEVNSSIGDAWQLGAVTPGGAVTIVDERYEGGDCASGAAGCSDGTLIWVIEVEGAGTVTFDADNCYRGACPGDEGAEPESERRTYTLNVNG